MTLFRVSTSAFYGSTTANINARQRELLTLNAQMTSGKRITTAADDPVGAANAADLRSSLSRLDQFKQNQSYSRHALSLGETAVTGAIDATMNARDLLMAAGNGAYTDADRASLADELEGVLARVVGLANSSDGDGGYLFAGGRDQATPYAQMGNQVRYKGGALGQTVEVASGRFLQVKFAGDALFGAMRPGNGSFVTAADAANTGTGTIDVGAVTQPGALTGGNYTISIAPDAAGDLAYTIVPAPAAGNATGKFVAPTSIEFDGMSIKLGGAPAAGDSFTVNPASSQPLFETLQQAITLLRTPVDGHPAGGARMTSQLGGLIASVDGAVAHLQATRSTMGAGLAELDAYGSLNDDRTLQQETRLSAVEDLDFAVAATQNASASLALQAAMQSYSSISRLSLFNYL
ncbi:MAG: flagellar hook-associated protein FlgL [Burkholderiaceae bacterium]